MLVDILISAKRAFASTSKISCLKLSEIAFRSKKICDERASLPGECIIQNANRPQHLILSAIITPTCNAKIVVLG